MWIVRIALDRPYTFIVLMILLPLIGILTLVGMPGKAGMPTDIFPEIRIPVIGVVFNYAGLPPDEISGRITSSFERPITTLVNDVEHVESQAYPGVTVIKVFFQPGADINLAMSQVTAFGQTFLRQLPPGTTPPLVLKYNASSVPIIQLALSSSKLSETELFDFGNQFIRTQLATVRGASIPFPYGGAQRQVQVDIDPVALRAHNLSANDVNNAIGNQNLILPSGTEKIGPIEYNIKLNASTFAIDELNNLPVRDANGSNGAITYVRDVAYVHDGHPPQTNIVRVNGQRAVLMTIQKTGSASTLEIIDAIKARLPLVREQLPEGAKVEPTGDQSVFVRAAIDGVVREGIIAAALTGLMILLFLGSWRSTLIITISIPLSILASIICLSALGETINIMTLGGLALAVGILVDDATVAIENINFHLEQGQEVEEAILEGARQIAVPALVSTFCICIVFLPMFLLSGVARYLFVPLAESVVFAMLASYVLSRTLIPTLSKYWLRKHQEHTEHSPKRNFFQRWQAGFEHRFTQLRDRYEKVLDGALHHRKLFAALFLGVMLLSTLLIPVLGRNFFPDVDAGQIKLHLRAPAGTRVEETAALTDRVEAEMKKVIPAKELAAMVDNVGLPSSGINLTYGTSGVVGTADADVLVTLTPEHHKTANYVRELRRRLPGLFPGTDFAFLPADIVSQILNFGLPSPIDIQVVGSSLDNRELASKMLADMRHIPGLVDLRIQQVFNYPEFRLDTDRSRLDQLGLTQKDVANNLLVATSGSFQTAPTFWLDTKKAIQYPIATQTPQYRLTSLQDLENLPVDVPGVPQQVLGALVSVTRGVGSGIVSKYDAQPIIDIFGAVQDRDLGSVSNDIKQVIAKYMQHPPKGTRIVARGQMQTMESSYVGLLIGLIGAIVLVYFLIVVNFQSWTDPLIIVSALPAALAGIAWMLFITGTTLSVPALTGAIMCMGVATANSILVVSFARERLDAGDNAIHAALNAGVGRLRPVMMTALAMIIGMVPMAMGLGEGGEQNAPLGRAVIGGLLLATLATLLFVPTVFALVHGRKGGSGSDHPRPPHPKSDQPGPSHPAVGQKASA